MTKNARTVQAVVLLALITFSTATGIALTSTSAGCLAANPPSTDSGSASPKEGYDPPEPVLAPDTPEIGLAAFKGDVGTVRRLIASGISTESTGKDQRTPLLLACGTGHIEVVSALLAAGANINARDDGGATALRWAAHRGDEKMALLLLSHRPEVNGQDEFGETPLMAAAMVGDKVIVEALLAAGANRDLIDVFGLTASACAKKSKHFDIASLLDRKP